jgi:hypothetical protein
VGYRNPLAVTSALAPGLVLTIGVWVPRSPSVLVTPRVGIHGRGRRAGLGGVGTPDRRHSLVDFVAAPRSAPAGLTLRTVRELHLPPTQPSGPAADERGGRRRDDDRRARLTPRAGTCVCARRADQALRMRLQVLPKASKMRSALEDCGGEPGGTAGEVHSDARTPSLHDAKI